MTKIQYKRLKKLADYMPSVPRKEFDMEAAFDCGTVACAAGHATRIFRRSGLFTSAGGMPIFSTCFGNVALQRFFGLSREQSLELFNIQALPSRETPKQWSRRCLRFLKSIKPL